MTAIWVPTRLSDLTAPVADVALGGFGFTGARAAAANGELVRYEESSQGIFSAKGDLLVASGSHASARLAVGSDGQRLEADSTATNGVKWASKEVIVLGVSGAAVTHTGDASEWVAATIAVPANTILANGMVVVTTIWQQTGAGATSPTLRLRFGATGSGTGGTVIAGATGQASGGTAGEQVWAFSNANSASAQVGAGPTINQTLLAMNSNISIATAAINTTAATEINITGQLATSANTLALKAYSVVVYPHA